MTNVHRLPVRLSDELGMPESMSAIQLAFCNHPWTLYRMLGDLGDKKWAVCALLSVMTEKHIIFYLASNDSKIFHIESYMDFEGETQEAIETEYADAKREIAESLRPIMGDLKIEPSGSSEGWHAG